MTQKLKKRRIFENPPLKNRSAWKAETYLEAYYSSLFKLLSKGVWSGHNENYNFCIEKNRKTSTKHLAKKVET